MSNLRKRRALTSDSSTGAWLGSLGFEVQRNRTFVRDSLGVEKKGGVTDLKFRNNEGKNLNLPRLALNAAAPVSTIYVSDTVMRN